MGADLDCTRSTSSHSLLTTLIDKGGPSWAVYVRWCVWWLERASNRGTKTTASAAQLPSVLFLPSTSRNARLKGSGMASCTASPHFLKTWFSWVRGSALLRLIGLPAALLTLYLETYGSSPATASLILHRLRRRLHLSSFFCTLTNRHDMTSTSDLEGADSMDRAQARTSNDTGARSTKRTGSDASTSTTLSHPSPTMPSHSRSKTTSQIDLVQQGKRLSLQFPIQPAAGSTSPSNSPRSRPQSWVGAPTPLLSPEAAPSPSETNILAVLAAQERYVLELKEELNKAEVDLKTLKKHYALHEANKRRNDVRKIAPLQPLNTSLANVKTDQDDEDGSNLWMQREMERRKALMSSTKTSQRKVFSGSRHLRTLSLLSPDRSYTPSFPQPLDLPDEEPIDQRPSLPARSSTSSDIRRQIADDTSDERYDLGGIPNIQRENLIRAGTQMATDFKNGLFTFIEDIRQATVGEEAVNGADGNYEPVSVRGPLKSSRKASDGRPPLNRAASSKKTRTGSIGDDFWKENGLSEPKTTTMNKKTHAIKSAQTPQKQIRKPADEDEDWDNWDTPNDTQVEKTADSTDSSDESDDATSPVSGPGSSRTSTRYHSKRHDSKASSLTTTSSTSNPDDAASRDPKRNSIPWPDLVKLSPNNLKRTASHLMKEWEKQLTPPPESRSANYSHGDYIGRSSSPAGLP
ncbi:hypothetical protein BKA66DRAFT_454829 [Pyrenochaeta sp. MPI-SDFR-AT-0127]|nr:hypothetical protein BKA66DRAFT_454829 [Pyrenochaeta sp. MPI-SDFR-AT-0127]